MDPACACLCVHKCACALHQHAVCIATMRELLELYQLHVLSCTSSEEEYLWKHASFRRQSHTRRHARALRVYVRTATDFANWKMCMKGCMYAHESLMDTPSLSGVNHHNVFVSEGHLTSHSTLPSRDARTRVRSHPFTAFSIATWRLFQGDAGI